MVCSQNIPQLSMNIWFMTVFGFHEVAVASAVFSLISMMVTVLAIYTERDMQLNRQCVLVQFTVLGLTVNDRKLQTQTRGIAMSLANLLRLHHKLVHIEQPRGFRFKVSLYINNVQYKDVDYEALMEDARNNGSLAEIIRNQWKLKKVPAIADLKYEEKRSEFQLMNMVEILMPKRSIADSVQPESRASFEPDIVAEEEAEGVQLLGMPKVVETPSGPFGGPHGMERLRATTSDCEQGGDNKTKQDTK